MEPEMPRHVGVVGGGRMGSGIAHAFLVCGSSMTLIEADAARVAAARDGVMHAIRGSVARGRAVEDEETIAARLTVVTDVAGLAGCGLVIEAVPEIGELKHSVLQAISAAVKPSAIIASNTSSMSISELAGFVTSPERFLGLHFFNPVPASQLVEVVVGRETLPATVDRARRIVEVLGKTAVTINDSPGFASSRLGVLLGLEAIRMVEEGVATPEDIDAAMVLGYKHPIGPLKLTDLVGLDVRLGIADYLASRLGDRFAPPRLLRDKVARGELGRKTGHGFYDWSAGDGPA
ncbi:MAG: 3-hydroxybutyryl-CoA dehydrogenase [Actinobacteria bacterium 69-20]|nr:3-hydroxyacyl-CoA dehydrogenase family protein [Actinomycetota bacterium]OJV25337.1 MAG: 3-hydroxybutyryl-CoA dehydrogenase [Actinobacteria bacterium 69-20]